MVVEQARFCTCALKCARLRQRVSFVGAAIAQLGERQTEDLKVPSSILGLGTYFHQILFIATRVAGLGYCDLYRFR